jgi:AcrR family transcriptional regulator
VTRSSAAPDIRLADAALRQLAKKAWSELSLAEIARSAKIPLAELQTLAPAKPALFGLVLRRFGAETAARYKPDRGAQTARDRLFDVAMTWFEILGSRKPAIRALYAGLRRDPLALLAQRGALIAAAEWLMTLAEADHGPAVTLRAAGFAAVLARTVPVWLDDDVDLTKTMAQLDGDLRRGESLIGRMQL